MLWPSIMDFKLFIYSLYFSYCYVTWVGRFSRCCSSIQVNWDPPTIANYCNSKKNCYHFLNVANSKGYYEEKNFFSFWHFLTNCTNLYPLRQPTGAGIPAQLMTHSRFNSSFSLFLIFTTFRVLICSSALSTPALLNKFWRILKNVSDDASAKLYVT